MRNNQPVTGHEHAIPFFREDASFRDRLPSPAASNTCNPAFIAVRALRAKNSSASRTILIRHPGARHLAKRPFAPDMRTTIRDGRPWTALVKNRRKNGDHYLGRRPTCHAGRQARRRGSGYSGVRVKPQREAVRAAEALYARMRSRRRARREAAARRRRHAARDGAGVCKRC